MKCLSFLCACLCLLWSCQGNESTAPETRPPTVDPLANHPGKEYYAQYCGICHALPDPGELDRKTWENYILVRMGAYMGIFWDNKRYYDEPPQAWLEPGEGGLKMIREGVYPSKPLLSRKEFEDIRDYVLQAAPAQTTGPATQPVPMDLEGFRIRSIQPDSSLQPFVSALHIDEEAQELYAGLFMQPLLRLDPQGAVIDSASGWTMPVEITRDKKGIHVVDIGSMGGSDNPQGSYRRARNFRALRKQRHKVDMGDLMRPVQHLYHDLDQDGEEDLIIAEFGYHFGRLVWHEANGKMWIPRELFNDDGTVAIDIRDWTGNGKPDILALQANSDERLLLYQNQGEGKFQAKILARFSPSAGSAAMEVADFDQDGRPEIIVCQGDNGDYPPILKAWHGVRIFSLSPELELKEENYLPMNGAYGTETRDYDQDGDLDIAAVAFYPNYQGRPEEAFIYFENTGDQQFQPHTFPQVGLSRWMVLEAGDLDGDGDEDIVLGGFNVKSDDASEETYQQWMADNVPILVLENSLK